MVINMDDDISQYFERHVGPVSPRQLLGIVSDDPPIAVRVVPAGPGRDYVTLFTIGMSRRPMIVPSGQDDYRFAELFIQLPPWWPLAPKELIDQNCVWPIHWLRQLAVYPHAAGTWLGGPVTIIANGDPPLPLAPEVPFSSFIRQPVAARISWPQPSWTSSLSATTGQSVRLGSFRKSCVS